jgi:hypothetical protein
VRQINEVHLYYNFPHFFFRSDFDPAQWVALGGSSNGDNTNEGNFQASTQIKVVRRIVTHPQARVTRGFVQNDLVRVFPLMTSFLSQAQGIFRYL